MSNLAITICATASYTYAMKAQARRVAACVNMEQGITSGKVILVGDDSDELMSVLRFYSELLPPHWSVDLVSGNFEDGLKNYKNPAQLVIARMRSRAFDAARRFQADICWSLDSDVLPPPNALRCMRAMLDFDGGYYSVSTCPYPSQGGGDFLGGRGTPQNPISPDVYDDEREIPEELQERMKVVKHGPVEQATVWSALPLEEWKTERDAVSEEVKKCKPLGNVFALNAKGWRKRGWMSSAYPAIGKGAVVPSDWCGFGCTLMNRQALALAQFDGYDGAGTEDLFVCWKKWHPAGLRINVIPHAPCDHVIRNPKKPGYFVHLMTGHEKSGECEGHLRMEPRPWYQQVEGEAFDEANDGRMR